MALECKDLLGMQYLNPEQINEIMHTAEQMKQILLQSSKKTPHLQGKSIVTLFYENSTRTRMSFELASKYMKMCIRDRAGGARRKEVVYPNGLSQRRCI